MINWRKDHLTWPSIRQDIDEHMLLAIHDCALALWPVIEDALVGGKSGCSKKSIIAPFVLFFTAAFVGDFVELCSGDGKEDRGQAEEDEAKV